MHAQIVLALELGAALVAVVDGVQRVVRHVHAQLVVELELLAALGAVVLVRAVLVAVVLPATENDRLQAPTPLIISSITCSSTEQHVPELDLVARLEVALGTLDLRAVRVLHVPIVHALRLERFVANLKQQ